MNSRHSTVCARDHLSKGKPCVCDFGKRAVIMNYSGPRDDDDETYWIDNPDEREPS